MLHSERVIDSVIDSLRSIKVIKIVLDPVMVAKSGAQLISDNAINILKNHLIKRVSLITPNIPEAEVLTDLKIKNIHDMTQAGQVLLSMGAKNVLIKGGHLKSKVVKDIFMNKKEIKVFLNKRLKTKNTHGTGCTLSSAITTFFSCGKLLNKSCELGIKYVNQSIRSNPNFGKGHGPINHLNSITINKKFR
jgi:hydroxymethylpyrimidine/phosphomethylpyrimidine kinase